MDADEISTEQILSEVGTLQEPAEKAEGGAGAGSHGDKKPEPPAQEFEYTIEGGRKVKEPLDMVLKRAGMGYHYAQKMHTYNKDMERLKQAEERAKTLSRWEEYDSFAKTNPDWAKHVDEAWANRQSLGKEGPQEGQGDPILMQKLQEMAQKLEKYEKFATEFASEKESLRYQQEDKAFESEIETVAKQYGLDLTEADADGRSLEWRVLNHMQELGLDGSKKGQFAAALKDYYFENLQNRQKDTAKENAAKTEAELKRAGIVDVSRSPKGQESFNGYQRGMSYNQLAELAKKEFINQ